MARSLPWAMSWWEESLVPTIPDFRDPSAAPRSVFAQYERFASHTTACPLAPGAVPASSAGHSSGLVSGMTDESGQIPLTIVAIWRICARWSGTPPRMSARRARTSTSTPVGSGWSALTRSSYSAYRAFASSSPEPIDARSLATASLRAVSCPFICWALSRAAAAEARSDWMAPTVAA